VSGLSTHGCQISYSACYQGQRSGVDLKVNPFLIKIKRTTGGKMKLGDERWIDSEIHREHALVSHRMNWYVASQAFLLTAFATGANKEHFIIKYIPLLIPIIGFVISAVSWLALVAALLSIEKLHKKQKIRCHDSVFIKFWYTGRPYIHRLGTLPPLIIPFLFMISWVIVIVKLREYMAIIGQC